MNIFKTFLTTVILLSSLNSWSATTENNVAWFTFPGGSVDSGCRVLWKEYDTKYNTVTTIMPPRAGLAGGLVVDDVLRSNRPISALCMGPSQFILNPLVFPSRTNEDQLEPLVIATRWAWVWYTPINVSANSYRDLIKHFKSLNRPINVGTFLPLHNIVEPILKQHGITVNLVNFKNPAQQYPSLADGSLDLAFDTGTGVPIADQTKKFKPVGYIDLKSNSFYPGLKNFADAEPDLKALMTAGGMVVAVPRSMPAAEKKQLTERLVAVINSDSFKATVAGFNNHPMGMTAPELFYYIETNRRIITRYWKQ